MKKIIVFAFATLVAAVACSPKLTTQQKIEEFDTQLQAIMDEYNAAEDKEAAGDVAIEKLCDLSFETVKNNPSDSVALYAIQQSYSYFEVDKLSEIVGLLSDELKATDMITELQAEIDAMSNTAEGKMFVDFTVKHVTGTDADGNPVYEDRSLSDYVAKGKYILVDFWSPWCPPCKAEIPNIKDVYNKYAGEKFDIVSVSVWEESRGMNWKNTVDTAAVYGINWNQMNNAHKEPAELYGISAIPHIILFGPDGTIVKRDLRGDALEQAVAEAVAE